MDKVGKYFESTVLSPFILEPWPTRFPSRILFHCGVRSREGCNVTFSTAQQTSEVGCVVVPYTQ